MAELLPLVAVQYINMRSYLYVLILRTATPVKRGRAALASNCCCIRWRALRTSGITTKESITVCVAFKSNISPAPLPLECAAVFADVATAGGDKRSFS